MSPPCWPEKLKYFPYFTVISVKMGHFKHQNFKTLIFSSWGRTPRPPAPFGPPLSNISGGNPGSFYFNSCLLFFFSGTASVESEDDLLPYKWVTSFAGKSCSCRLGIKILYITPFCCDARIKFSRLFSPRRLR